MTVALNSESARGTLMVKKNTLSGARYITIEEFHQHILEGRYRQQIEAMLQAYSEGVTVVEKDRQGVEHQVPKGDVLKGSLPCMLVHAMVSGRRLFGHVEQFNDYMPIDIDKLANADEVARKLSAYRWVKEVHKSCSGRGVHAIVKTPSIPIDESLPMKEREQAYREAYKRVYEAVCNVLEQDLGVEMDHQCSDVLRELFVSYDKDAFLRADEETEVFPYSDTSSVQTAPVQTATAQRPTADEASQVPEAEAEAPARKEQTVDPELVVNYVKYNQYKATKRHKWWVDYGVYLRYHDVPLQLYAEYCKMALVVLKKRNLVKSDDPLLRSATEVEEAMRWGFANGTPKGGHGAGVPLTALVAQLEGEKYDDSRFRMQMPQLPMGMKESVKGCPPETTMAILVGLMPMMMCYASNVSAVYCDGKTTRLNAMALVVSEQGGMKSSVKYKLDLWREPMRESDKVARRLEDEYKALRKNRKANEELPPEPHNLITEVPITVSCSTLLKRLKNADGRHLFSFCEELDTLRKTNGAGSWSSKYDVYRYSFDNGEWGQDYNSDQAESGMASVAYNWTILGTLGALSKCFNSDNVENGLAGRVMVARMPSNLFSHMPTYKDESQADVEAILRAVEVLRQAHGLLVLPRLQRGITEWCNKKADEARQNNDRVLDTFRKRAAMIGFRCGVVFYLLEQKEKVTTACVDFAVLMAEYVLFNQCELFGSLLLERRTTMGDGSGYRCSSKSAFDDLKSTFTMDELAALCPDKSHNALRIMVSRWKHNGAVVPIDKNRWKKC